jgi:hypothetical protein
LWIKRVRLDSCNEFFLNLKVLIYFCTTSWRRTLLESFYQWFTNWTVFITFQQFASFLVFNSFRYFVQPWPERAEPNTLHWGDRPPDPACWQTCTGSTGSSPSDRAGWQPGVGPLSTGYRSHVWAAPCTPGSPTGFVECSGRPPRLECEHLLSVGSDIWKFKKQSLCLDERKMFFSEWDWISLVDKSKQF